MKNYKVITNNFSFIPISCNPKYSKDKIFTRKCESKHVPYLSKYKKLHQVFLSKYDKMLKMEKLFIHSCPKLKLQLVL